MKDCTPKDKWKIITAMHSSSGEHLRAADENITLQEQKFPNSDHNF